MQNPTTIAKQSVRIVPIDENLDGELASVIHYECGFCEKTVGLYPAARKLCERLSGSEFYCTFCLRHGFNTRSNRHVLPLSFRAIAGYYYYDKYLYATNRQMWISEIRDMMEMHEKAGLRNPVFSYDPETYQWFIDFSKIGNSKHKLRIVEVYKTVLSVLTCFNLDDHIPGVKMAKLFEKYAVAIDKFYTQRYRPEGRRILIPTLASCGPTESKKYSLDNTRFLLPRHLA
jgi:hypothetical protein